MLLSTRVASAQFSFGVARGCKGRRAITIIIISIIVVTFILHFDYYCCYSCGYDNYYYYYRILQGGWFKRGGS